MTGSSDGKIRVVSVHSKSRAPGGMARRRLEALGATSSGSSVSWRPQVSIQVERARQGSVEYPIERMALSPAWGP